MYFTHFIHLNFMYFLIIFYFLIKCNTQESEVFRPSRHLTLPDIH